MLVGEKHKWLPVKNVSTIWRIDAWGLQDGFMAGYSVSSVNRLCNTWPGISGPEVTQRKGDGVKGAHTDRIIILQGRDQHPFAVP